MNAPLRLGLVGFGKIARDQHLPAIAATSGAELVAVASRHGIAEGFANYPDIDALLAGEPDLDAIVMCQPPQGRYQDARRALIAGKHVFLEKPPGATVSQVEALIEIARVQGVSLFASWHSRFAPGVATARSWLEGRRLRKAQITWKEDVRYWHPGQTWIFEAGGFGVFDPGINALSILTTIVRDPIVLAQAELEVPSNRQAPIAARLRLHTTDGATIDAEFDFRQTGPQSWDISIEAEDGAILLSEGGAKLALNGLPHEAPLEGEYPAMYRHFIELVRGGRSDVDVAPLRLVADAFLCGGHRQVDPFDD